MKEKARLKTDASKIAISKLRIVEAKAVFHPYSLHITIILEMQGT